MALVTREDVGRVAVLCLSNPPANGYSHAMHRELDAHVLDIRMDDGIDVILLRGSGEKFFCAGADINYLRSLTPDQKYAFCLHANETLLRLEHTPKLVIAALNGHCVGGGLEVALACDLRVGRATVPGGRPDQIGLPEVSLGVLPGTGGTQRLSRLIGRGRALQWMVEGRNASMEEGLAEGLVHRLFPVAGFFDEVLAFAETFCRPHRASGAVGLIKRAVVSGADLPLESGLALERELQQRLFTAPDAAEGLAAFVGKRKPQFTGGAGEGRGEPRPEVRAEPRPEVRPEPKPEVRPEPRHEGRPEPRVEPRPEPRSEPISRMRIAPSPASEALRRPASAPTVAPAVARAGESLPARQEAPDQGRERQDWRALAVRSAATGWDPPDPDGRQQGRGLGGDDEETGAGRGFDPFDPGRRRGGVGGGAGAEPAARFDLSRTRLHDEAMNLVGRDVVERYMLIPVRREGNVLIVAAANPSAEARRAVQEECGLQVRMVQADELDIAVAIAQNYRA